MSPVLLSNLAVVWLSLIIGTGCGSIAAFKVRNSRHSSFNYKGVKANSSRISSEFEVSSELLSSYVTPEYLRSAFFLEKSYCRPYTSRKHDQGNVTEKLNEFLTRGMLLSSADQSNDDTSHKDPSFFFRSRAYQKVCYILSKYEKSISLSSMPILLGLLRYEGMGFKGEESYFAKHGKHKSSILNRLCALLKGYSQGIGLDEYFLNEK